MNANAVQANEPTKLINRPNLGMIMANMAVNMTKTVRKHISFESCKPYVEGVWLKKLESSKISKTGIICKG